jgi:hypothetical protein
MPTTGYLRGREEAAIGRGMANAYSYDLDVLLQHRLIPQPGGLEGLWDGALDAEPAEDRGDRLIEGAVAPGCLRKLVEKAVGAGLAFPWGYPSTPFARAVPGVAPITARAFLLASSCTRPLPSKSREAEGPRQWE